MIRMSLALPLHTYHFHVEYISLNVVFYGYPSMNRILPNAACRLCCLKCLHQHMINMQVMTERRHRQETFVSILDGTESTSAIQTQALMLTGTNQARRVSFPVSAIVSHRRGPTPPPKRAHQAAPFQHHLSLPTTPRLSLIAVCYMAPK